MSLKKFTISNNIKKCIQETLNAEGIGVRCEINVLITNDAGIQVINRESRQLDKPTDVLSFPMFDLEAGNPPADWEEYRDPETGRVPLGDMCISLERAMEQANEFGHGIKREIGYLTVHSVLHLLGYDHLDEGPMKRQMRRQEETIMAQLLLTR